MSQVADQSSKAAQFSIQRFTAGLKAAATDQFGGGGAAGNTHCFRTQAGGVNDGAWGQDDQAHCDHDADADGGE